MPPDSKVGTIAQKVIINGSTPHAVFEVLMDEKQHAVLTKGEVQISRKVGGAFTTFDGWASGHNVSLVPGKKIVQTWRADDWPADVMSTITVQLLPAPKGTKLLFTQTGVPANKAKDIARGWRDYYWGPLQEFFAGS